MTGRAKRATTPIPGARAAVLASITILYITLNLPTHVFDTARRCWDAFAQGRAGAGGETQSGVSLFVTTQNSTLAVDDRINSLIDLYAPFLSPDSPLLKLGNQSLAFPDVNTSTMRAWLGGPEDDVEGWSLPRTHKRVIDICYSPLMDGSGLEYEQVLDALWIKLSSAYEKQNEVAGSLASRHTVVLWLYRVRMKFLGLFIDLHNVAEVPNVSPAAYYTEGNSATAKAAANKKKKEIADALCRHAEEGGPWHSINKEIRRTLLRLRQDCVSISNQLGELYLHYDRVVVGLGQREDGKSTTVGLYKPKPAPVVHIELMISAIDNYVAALDAVDDGLLQFRTLLADLARNGWKTEELRDGAPVRVLYDLPTPQDILESVYKRLERLVDDYSYLQHMWSLSKKDSSAT